MIVIERLLITVTWENILVEDSVESQNRLWETSLKLWIEGQMIGYLQPAAAPIPKSGKCMLTSRFTEWKFYGRSSGLYLMIYLSSLLRSGYSPSAAVQWAITFLQYYPLGLQLYFARCIPQNFALLLS